MNYLTLDFETFYSDEFTLKKLSQEAYCRDPRFEAHGVALKSADEKPYWIAQPRISGHLNQFDWNNIAVICWHAQFDCFILNHTYGIRPKFIICPMSMARLMLGAHVGVSLDSIRSHFGLPPKNYAVQSVHLAAALERDDPGCAAPGSEKARGGRSEFNFGQFSISCWQEIS